MSKYRGPRLRIVRRLFSPRPGTIELFTRKIQKSNFRPGQHGAKKTKKPTQFSIRLQEKQKLRTYYAISEKQLIRYVKKARKIKEPTGLVLNRLLELRLDIRVYHIGWRRSLLEARQIVNHGHIMVNGKRTSSRSRSIAEGTPLSTNHHQTRHQRFRSENYFTHLPQSQKYINYQLVVEYYSNRL